MPRGGGVLGGICVTFVLICPIRLGPWLEVNCVMA